MGDPYNASTEGYQRHRASFTQPGTRSVEAAIKHRLTQRLARTLLKADNLLWEQRLGISTRGISGKDQGASSEHLYYATMPYRSLFRIFRGLSLRSSDVIVDLGCGKGRVVCCAATLDVCEAIGVDDVESLCETARRNARHLRNKRAPISIIQARVQDFDYARGTVFYLYNPFGPETLRAVIEKLHRALREHRRPIRIVYANPVHDHVLEQTPWLVRSHDLQPFGHAVLGAPTHALSLWQTREV